MHDKLLTSFNAVVSAFTVITPAVDWILFNKKKFQAYVTLSIIENFSLVISLAVLVWGLLKLIKEMQHVRQVTVNTKLIFLHILAYLFIIVADITQIVLGLYKDQTYVEYEYVTIGLLVINSICSFILALIVNALVSKIINQLDDQTNRYSSMMSTLRETYKSSIEQTTENEGDEI